mmetsp:Transcript_22367/g.62276  ORF Transcript_22367/g.62276 Transcript_22367/m.62276 type:complete len:214 (-) Transcript_22367:1094-1735(-)
MVVVIMSTQDYCINADQGIHTTSYYHAYTQCIESCNTKQYKTIQNKTTRDHRPKHKNKHKHKHQHHQQLTMTYPSRMNSVRMVMMRKCVGGSASDSSLSRSARILKRSSRICRQLPIAAASPPRSPLSRSSMSVISRSSMISSMRAYGSEYIMASSSDPRLPLASIRIWSAQVWPASTDREGSLRKSRNSLRVTRASSEASTATSFWMSRWRW